MPVSADEFFEIRAADHTERRTALRLRIVVATLAVLGLGVTWATGGLARDPVYTADGVQTVAVGESVDTGPLRMSVEAAAVFDEYGDVRPFGGEGYLLIVKLTMENLSNRTRSILSGAVALEGVSGLKDTSPMRVVLVRDSSSAYALEPALPEQVAFVWQLLPGTTAPEEINVVLLGATWRKTNFSFINEWYWWDDGPRAETTVPVEDRRAGR